MKNTKGNVVSWEMKRPVDLDNLRKIKQALEENKMATKFEDFMKEIEDEAKAEGPQAVEEICLLRKFFNSERQKPIHLRNNHCYISCRCSSCNSGTLK